MQWYLSGKVSRGDRHCPGHTSIIRFALHLICQACHARSAMKSILTSSTAMDFVMVMQQPQPGNTGGDIHEEGAQIHECFIVYTNIFATQAVSQVLI